MKECGLALLATAIIKQALYEEGWNYLDSPEGKYRQNLEKNAEELRKKIIISVDINNVKC